MLVKVCNRCTAQVPVGASAALVTLPVLAPATRPGQVPSTPFVLTMALQLTDPGMDLCQICFAAATLQYVLTTLGGSIPPQVARALQAQIAAAVAGS